MKKYKEPKADIIEIITNGTEWWWCVLAPNGKVLLRSYDHYKKQNCVTSALKFATRNGILIR